MSLKERILAEIEELSLDRLSLVVEYIRLLKEAQLHPEPFGWKKAVGSISAEDGKETERIVKGEFDKIEGEW